jgi:predicted glycoside hydrolase/deacetylase ChbG (UPF0249 family)
MPSRIFAADDWGLSPAINAGILALAEHGWLYSVSLMATAPYVQRDLAALLAHRGIEFSLHLNFTYGQALHPDLPTLTKVGRFFSHKQLMCRAFTGRVAALDVENEFAAQLSHLHRLNVPVTGVDGHHHVHLLPGLVRPLHAAFVKAGIQNIRLMEDRAHRASYLQTSIYKRFIAPRGLHPAPCAYLLPEDLRTSENFRRKLEKVNPKPLLVHPALYNDFKESGMLDPLRDERVRELHAVMKYLND